MRLYKTFVVGDLSPSHDTKVPATNHFQESNMIWINKHKRLWRTAALPLLIIALTGPWSFDLINVPAEYPCSLPNYRLEGDFCGIPFSLLWGIPVFFRSFFRIVSGLLAGTTIPPDLSWGLLFSVSSLVLFLPFLTTWSLISRGSHQSRFAVVSWGLVIGVAYHFFGNSFLARPHPGLDNIWLYRGVWLYIAVAIIALVLELIMFKTGSKVAPETTVTD
jgi:hypothetical protein